MHPRCSWADKALRFSTVSEQKTATSSKRETGRGREGKKSILGGHGGQSSDLQ